jgi:hypothetical protein
VPEAPALARDALPTFSAEIRFIHGERSTCDQKARTRRPSLVEAQAQRFKRDGDEE